MPIWIQENNSPREIGKLWVQESTGPAQIGKVWVQESDGPKLIWEDFYYLLKDGTYQNNFTATLRGNLNGNTGYNPLSYTTGSGIKYDGTLAAGNSRGGNAYFTTQVDVTNYSHLICKINLNNSAWSGNNGEFNFASGRCIWIGLASRVGSATESPTFVRSYSVTYGSSINKTEWIIDCGDLSGQYYVAIWTSWRNASYTPFRFTDIYFASEAVQDTEKIYFVKNGVVQDSFGNFTLVKQVYSSALTIADGQIHLQNQNSGSRSLVYSTKQVNWSQYRHLYVKVNATSVPYSNINFGIDKGAHNADSSWLQNDTTRFSFYKEYTSPTWSTGQVLTFNIIAVPYTAQFYFGMLNNVGDLYITDIYATKA